MISGGTGLVGGFIGQVHSGVVRYCYSFGNSSGTTAIGGFIGFLTAGTVEYCYSIGHVYGAGRGGFICQGDYSGTVHNYYSTDRSGCNDTKGATGISSTAFYTPANLVEWDFSTVWNLSSANWSYPHLRNNLPSF